MSNARNLANLLGTGTTVPAAAVNNASLNNVTTLPAGVGGKVLQVQSTTKTDVFSDASTASDITGLSLTITPASTSSKILVIAQVHIHGANAGTGIRLVRGSTALGLGDAAGSRTRSTMAGFYSSLASPDQYSSGANHINYLDSPNTTSATTYKLQGGTINGSTYYINQTYYNQDNNNANRCSSTLTLMEIAA